VAVESVPEEARLDFVYQRLLRSVLPCLCELCVVCLCHAGWKMAPAAGRTARRAVGQAPSRRDRLGRASSPPASSSRSLLRTYRRARRSVTCLFSNALHTRPELRDYLAEHHPEDLAFFESVLAESEGRVAG